MVAVPNPVNLFRSDNGEGATEGDDAPRAVPAPGKGMTTFGGRHGSPSIVVSMPFSAVKILDSDPDAKATMLELAEIVTALSQTVTVLAEAAPEDAGIDRDVVTKLQTRATELRDQLLADVASED